MSFNIKRNDRSPALSAVLEAPAGSPIDLTGTSVMFFMVLDGASSPKVSAAATLVDAANGSVEYDWLGTDTDTAGLYRAEFQVTFAGGVKRTFPEADYIYINVVPDLG